PWSLLTLTTLRLQARYGAGTAACIWTINCSRTRQATRPTVISGAVASVRFTCNATTVSPRNTEKAARVARNCWRVPDVPITISEIALISPLPERVQSHEPPPVRPEVAVPRVQQPRLHVVPVPSVGNIEPDTRHGLRRVGA